MSAEYHCLNNGLRIPSLGMGTYYTKKETLDDVIKSGIEIGYRLIDTAFIYDREAEIGRALQDVWRENIIERENLFIVSKIWPTYQDPKDVLSGIKRSLRDLQLDYVDLYLMHWPWAQIHQPGKNEYDTRNDPINRNVTIEQTWCAMEELVKGGYTKSIGLSNFSTRQIDRIFEVASIKPVVNQFECNPYMSQEELRRFCKHRDLVVMGYRPFYGRRNLDPLTDPTIVTLSHKYDRTPAQIILRYLLQCEVVPIPKTDNLQRLKENFNIWNWELRPEDFKTMKSLNKNIRCTTFPLPDKNFEENPFKFNDF